jgi:hypothetical protein
LKNAASPWYGGELPLQRKWAFGAIFVWALFMVIIPGDKGSVKAISMGIFPEIAIGAK